VIVIGKGLTQSRSGPSSEWTAEATASIDEALGLLSRQSPAFDIVDDPELTTAERAAIDEAMAVALRVQLTVHNRATRFTSKARRDAVDRTLGPSLSFLERTGAKYGLGVTALQVEQKKESIAANAGLMATSLFTGSLLALPAVTGSASMAFLIDLQTGELVWTQDRSGFELAGINFTDLRDPESAQKVVGQLLEPFGGLTAAPGTSSAATTARPGRAMSALDGEFAFVPPEGWHSTADKRLVTATRNGALLDEIRVELRRHDVAFPESGQESSRSSAPERLAEQYVEEIHRLGLDDVQIGERTFDVTMAGLPAFRLRYSFRSPLATGGARIERITVGTAVPRGLLLAHLSAPQLSYFEKARPAFEDSIPTLQLVPEIVLPR
jgi:hypothetical protein